MKALYWVTGMYPTDHGHMYEVIPGIEPTPRKREGIRRGKQFLATNDDAFKYSHMFLVRIDETAQEQGVYRFK